MAIKSFEFVIDGPPFSVNQAKKQPRKHNRWKAEVGRAARAQWVEDKRALQDLPLSMPMEVVITTYFAALQIDVDNVVKPIPDGLKNVLYVDDGNIYKLTSQRFELDASIEFDPFNPLVRAALEKTQELVHIVLLWEESEEQL